MKSIMMKNLIAALAGGVILFVWGSISWTMLPWRDATVETFPDENLVMRSLVENAPATGLYYIPADDADYAVDTPTAFINIKKEGFGVGMGEMMIKGLILNILMALLVVCLLRTTSNLDYKQRLGFVTMTGLLIGIAANGPYWNWFGFPDYYTFIQTVDTVIMWFLAGLVLAKLVPGRE